MFEAVFFDLDGVISDSVNAVHESYVAVFRKYGLSPEPTREDVMRLIGAPAKEMWRDVLPADRKGDAFTDMSWKVVTAQYNVMLPKLVRFYPGMLGIAKRAKARFKTALITNCPREQTMNVLALGGLSGYFDFVLTYEEITRPKPAPDSFVLAAKRLGLSDPGKILVIGDTRYDIEGGRAAGMRTCWAKWGYGRDVEGADFVAEKPEDLISIMGV
jgi:HAD superfamily hydrolase (TIGR01509 family)